METHITFTGTWARSVSRTKIRALRGIYMILTVQPHKWPHKHILSTVCLSNRSRPKSVSDKQLCLNGRPGSFHTHAPMNKTPIETLMASAKWPVEQGQTRPKKTHLGARTPWERWEVSWSDVMNRGRQTGLGMCLTELATAVGRDRGWDDFPCLYVIRYL